MATFIVQAVASILSPQSVDAQHGPQIFPQFLHHSARQHPGPDRGFTTSSALLALFFHDFFVLFSIYHVVVGFKLAHNFEVRGAAPLGTVTHRDSELETLAQILQRLLLTLLEAALKAGGCGRAAASRRRRIRQQLQRLNVGQLRFELRRLEGFLRLERDDVTVFFWFWIVWKWIFDCIFFWFCSKDRHRKRKRKRREEDFCRHFPMLERISFCCFLFVRDKPLYTTSFAACAVVDCWGKRCSESAD